MDVAPADGPADVAAGGVALGGVALGGVAAGDVTPGDAVPAGVLPVAGAWTRWLPVVGMDWVAVTGGGEPGAVPSDAAASPEGDPVRTEPCVRSLMPVSPSPGGAGRSPAGPGRYRCQLRPD
jgi:hypothetical protein